MISMAHIVSRWGSIANIRLQNEQATRRKLEDEVRALKRAAGPGKSPLSPR
jgi:hypothetical protein